MFRVRVVATGVAGSPWYVNMHFDTGTAQGAAEKARAFFAGIAADLSSAITYTVQGEVGIVNVATGELEDVAPVTVAPLQGGGVAALAPTATQGLVRINTNVIRLGRRVQGRIFVPGLTPATVGTNGAPATPFLGRLQTAANVLSESATAPILGVYSPPRVLTGPVVLPGSFSPASGAIARSKFGSIRSRRD